MSKRMQRALIGTILPAASLMIPAAGCDEDTVQGLALPPAGAVEIVEGVLSGGPLTPLPPAGPGNLVAGIFSPTSVGPMPAEAGTPNPVCGLPGC